jgi:7,8-dihydropterin-6-yl-methyl-4-(beta-D-ribofuranosyl)aminobenzene 5'-phosphate synthase
MLKINILAEDHVRKRGILGEHGYSILVELDGFRVLFDAGQTEILFLNAEKAGIDISNINALVISHGHYDHCGGVSEFCRLNMHAPVYIHPEAFCERYSSDDGVHSGSKIGISWYRGRNPYRDRTILVEKPLQIHKQIAISGEVPRIVSFEEPPKNFLRRSGNGDFVTDKVIDEQFMIVKGLKGIYIFVGCSHPGVINCIKYASKLFPGEKLVGLIGGMHLGEANETRIQATIQQFIESGIDVVIPLHCSGITATSEMKRLMREKCTLLACGDEFIFER